MNTHSEQLVYPNPIVLSLLGINATHEQGYTVDRKTGSDDYVFEYFDSPVFLQDDTKRQAHKGSVFILYTPGQPQYFRADAPLKHTWFQMSGEGVAECIDRYNIPVNQAVPVDHPDFLTPLLEEAQRLLVRKQQFWEDALTEIGRSLFRNLGRTLYHKNSTELSPFQKDLLATLHKVRAQVYKDLKRRGTVDDMANLANMSPARFAIAYRSNFGTGPIDDLIDFRLRHAEILLRYLPISIVDAAQHSGFNTASNFHVLFRERTGKSPRDLRKMNGRSMNFITDTENPFQGWEAAQKINLLYIRPVGYWSFDLADDVVIDDLRKHPKAQLVNNVTFAPGRLTGQALHFDGTGYATIPEAIVDTSHSYTVCAWLLYDQAGRMTAVSIGNAHHGAFYLQYITLDGGFKFAVTRSDKDAMGIYVVSSEPTVDGQWYHVTGVHDAERHEIRLYLNGRLQGITSYKTPWRADGSTYFGSCHVMDTMIDRWYGSIDDIRLYDTTLSEAEIETLYRDRTENKPLESQVA